MGLSPPHFLVKYHNNLFFYISPTEFSLLNLFSHALGDAAWLLKIRFGESKTNTRSVNIGRILDCRDRSDSFRDVRVG